MGKEPMTTPNQGEQTAREAAEAWLGKAKGVPELSSRCGWEHGAAIYGYLAGYHEGRAKGLEEAARIAEDLHASLAGGQEIAQAIRAAVAPSQKPPQT